ncbi:MAG: exosortase A, partial [Novosphingobium sp.]|nr:exosortase A [Novosphingobium sp.]
MPPEATAVSAGGDVPARGLSAAWRAALVRLSLAWAALMVLFASDWAAMVGQWWNSSTYNHMLLVPAIIAWLVWLRVPQLVRLVPQPWWPGLGLVAAATLLWVLGALAAFSLVTEAGAVALLIASVPTLLGPRVAAGLLFPLGYMAFLVPFGDELIPALQMITARLTIALTALSHVPAVIDGVFINTPAGLFEVAEACSGVKFLIAMVAFGVLVANVCFRSWWRRAAFLAIAVATPILANGVRAWGTIYVAQYKGAAWAGGFDHIVYGWIFFAVVIAVTIALAWRFFDRPSTDPMIDGAALAASPLLARLSRLQMPANAALAAIIACAVVGLAWASAADRLSAPLPRRIELPEVAGWHRVDYRPQVWWEPRATGAEQRLLGRYDDGQGHQVDVFFALYAS